MVRALDFRRHSIVFLGKTLHSHSAALHPGVSMGTRKSYAGGNHAIGEQPSQGGGEILLVFCCFGNQSYAKALHPLNLNTNTWPLTFSV